jgi:heme exporter protein D
MLDLGPHAAFIVAAYAVTFLALAALALFIVEDDRKQRRQLAALEAGGIKRRSAKNETAKPKRKHQ